MLLSFDFHYQTSKHHLHHKYISNFISSFPKTPKNQTSKLHLHHKYIYFQLWFISSFPTKHLPIEQNKTWTNKIKPKKKKKKKKNNQKTLDKKLINKKKKTTSILERNYVSFTSSKILTFYPSSWWCWYLEVLETLN